MTTAPHPRLPASSSRQSDEHARENNRYTNLAPAAAAGNRSGVLSISAHWITRGTQVTAMEHPRRSTTSTVSQELFDVRYPAPGDPRLPSACRLSHRSRWASTSRGDSTTAPVGAQHRRMPVSPSFNSRSMDAAGGISSCARHAPRAAARRRRIDRRQRQRRAQPRRDEAKRGSRMTGRCASATMFATQSQPAITAG